MVNVNNEVQIDETPIKWCSVSLSEIVDNGKRLEASVFDVTSKSAIKILSKCNFEKVNLSSENGFVKRAYYGGRLKRKYVSKSDTGAVGFIGSSEMLDAYPSPVKYMISDETVDTLKVSRGTILISRSGTIGNLALVNKTLEKFLISEHAIRLECRQVPGYVYAYLKSDIGQALIKSKIYGAVIQQIEPEHLADIPIPNASIAIKENINDLIVRSYEMRDEANEILDKANKLLIDELKLPPLSEVEDALKKNDIGLNAFSVKLSGLHGRADASYHVPVVEEIKKYLEKNSKEVTNVGDPRISSNVILPGRFKRIYVEKGFGRVFIGGKQLFEIDPSNKKYLSVVHHADRITKQLELHENMTLITCSGTIGKVTLVPKHWENWTANQHIIRVVPANSDIAGYLSVFLASEYGFQLIRRFTYGSVVDEIDDNHVKEIMIPLLKNAKIQSEINSLAIEANEKRYKAYQLEMEALNILNKDVLYS